MTGGHDPEEPRPGDAAHQVMCAQVVVLLGEYVEGALPSRRRLDVSRHLDACPECRAFLDQLRATRAAVGRLPDVDGLPQHLQDLLVMRFRSALPAQQPPQLPAQQLPERPPGSDPEGQHPDT